LTGFPKTMPGSASQTFYRYFPVAQRDRDWGVYVTTVGEARISPGSAYPPGGHPKSYDFRAAAGRCLREHQIIYISAGEGWFKSAESGRVKIEAGTVILLFPDVWHSYAPAEKVGWNEHWVGFNGDIPRRLVGKGFFGPERPVLRAGEEGRLLALFGDILEATRSNHPALQQIMAGAVVTMLAMLFSEQQSRLAGDDPGLQLIHRAVTRMRENPETPLSIPALASELNVSYRWFRRAFAHHTGLSPHQYFLDVRLARARDLLAQTTLPTKEIAARVGFEDAQYFCRLFHKKVGFAPGVWRERAQNCVRS
jgi:AraC-like DNA-binding protein